jgi:hypothetical protein
MQMIEISKQKPIAPINFISRLPLMKTGRQALKQQQHLVQQHRLQQQYTHIEKNKTSEITLPIPRPRPPVDVPKKIPYCPMGESITDPPAGTEDQFPIFVPAGHSWASATATMHKSTTGRRVLTAEDGGKEVDRMVGLLSSSIE